MSDTAAKLDILIAVQSQIADLLKTQQGFREAKQEASSFGLLLRQGLGIGTGIEIARRGIETLKSVIVSSAIAATALAGQLKDTSENLQISAEALQVLGLSAEDGGASVEKLNEALVHLKQAGAEAKTGLGATATIFNDLNIDAVRFTELPLERQLETFARAIINAKDQSKAFNDALQVLGARTAPQLMNMLRDLAGDGYDHLAASVRASGRIMEQETIERLDRAQKTLERFRRSLVIFAGETLASLSRLTGIGSAPAAPARALQPTEDFWSSFNKSSLRAGETELNILKETYALQQRMSAESPFGRISDNSAVVFLTQMRDRLAENIRLASADLPEAFRKLGSLKQSEFPHAITELLPPAVKGDDKTTNDFLRGLSDENLKRIEAINKALADYRDLTREIQAKQTGGTDAFTRQRFAFEGINNPRANPNFMTPMQGAVSGAMSWATDLGSVGEQVATQINSTIGQSVRGVSEELANWAVTGKMSGDVLAQLGMSVFTGWIQSIIQMGVQWLITQMLIRTGLLTTDALQSTLLAKKTVEVNAANAATLPANTANAATASVSSFGLAAVLGIAAMLAMMAIFGGFREHGGSVDAGVPYVVGERRPEVFIPSTAGRIVPTTEGFTRTMPGLGASPSVGASKPRVYLMRPSTEQDFEAMRRLPQWDVHVVDSVQRNKGDILNS
jgi:hypothetical protein